MTGFNAAKKRLADQRRSAQIYQRAQAKPNFKSSQEFQWQAGDIAFLKADTNFSDLDYQSLIRSKYLPSSATCHPVIILERRTDDASHVLVTTVSAYGCTSRGDSRAPWNQNCHRGKDVAAFRSFVGSERPSTDRPLLRLQGDKLMPKPEASWVYIQNVYVVPITVLGNFNKSPTRLRMDPASLADLRAHISQRTHLAKEVRADPRLNESVNGGEITRLQPATPQAQRPVVAPAPTTIATGGVPRRGPRPNYARAAAAIPRPVAAAS